MKIKFSIIVIFYFSLFLLTGHSSLGAQNPFDISSRLQDSLHTVVETRVDSNKFENPFDVDHVPLTKSTNKENAPIISDRALTVREESGTNGSGFIFWILLFSLLVLAILINSNRSLFVRLFRAIPNENLLRLIQREESNGISPYFIILFVFFVVNAGLFVYLYFHHFKEYSGFSIYIYCLLGVAGVYIVRHISLYLIRVIFPFKRAVSSFSFSIILFNGVMSVFLLPLNAFLAYGPTALFVPLFYFSCAIILVFYLIRQLRGFFIALGAIDFNFFHFFIYFCTCEIAPLFVILNFLTL